MTLWPAALLLGWLVFILVAERAFPAERVPDDNLRRIARNAMLGVLALSVSPVLLWTVGRAGGSVPPLIAVDTLVGPAAGLVTQLLALDLWAYFVHRAYHRVPFMWRLHAPHHFDRHLDMSTAFRFHMGEIVWSGLLRLIPALALGIDAPTMLLFETILLASTAFHHSNLALPPRFESVLARLLVTPPMHRIHHHRIQADTDSNYTAILSIWDRLLGSANAKRWQRGMDIGVEGEEERRLPGLLRYPFSRATDG